MAEGMSVEKRRAIETAENERTLLFLVDQSGLSGKTKSGIKGQLAQVAREKFSWAAKRRFLDWFSIERKRYSGLEGERMAKLYFELRDYFQEQKE